jgi:RES domain
VWYRIHRAEHEPRHFGRTGDNRFNDPSRRYGVLYASETVDGAFIETFGRNPGVNVVRESQLAERSLALIETLRPLKLVDLTGPGLAQIGATNLLTAGPHALARRWSRALWSHPSRPDGLVYRARHDPSCICVAIFDRTAPFIRAVPQGGLLDPAHRPLVGAILRRYDFSLLSDVPGVS